MTEQTTSISITENNSVKKVILQKSPLPFQQNPNQGDKVSFFYMISFPFSFENKAIALAKISEKPLEIEIGSSDYLEILNICLKNSLIGERAEFRIYQNYKNFEVLCKMNNIKLSNETIQKRLENEEINFIKIEIELCKVTPKPYQSRSNILNSQNLKSYRNDIFKKCENLKETADTFFKSGQYDEALEVYEKLSKMVNFEYGKEGEEKDFTDLKKRILMNFAYCSYKAKKFEQSVKISKWILSEIEDDNYKILFRLGMVYFDQGQFSEALGVFKRALNCVLEGSADYKNSKKKVNSCMKMMRNKDNLMRKKMAEAIKRDEVQAGDEIEMEKSRADEFDKEKLLGEGNFSQIYLVKEKSTGEVSALKVFEKAKVTRMRKHKDVLMEKYVLNKLKDVEEVINLYETFRDKINVYMRFEPALGGEIWDICKSFSFNSKAKIHFYFAQILTAIKKIQQYGIVHRDIKPENILLTENKKRIKLVDFGTSWDSQNPKMKGSGNGSTGRKVFDHFVGTPHYMPVEFIRNRGSYLKSDIYSLGCMLYQFFAGYQPFLGGSEYLIFQQSVDGELKFYDFFPEDLKELITWMMDKDHEKRPSVEEVIQHGYFDEFRDVDLEEDFENDFGKFMSNEEKFLDDARKFLMGLDGDEKNEEKVKEEIEKFKKQWKASENQNCDLMKSKLGHLEQKILHYLGLKKFQHYY